MVDFTTLTEATGRDGADELAIARSGNTLRMTVAVLIAGLLTDSDIADFLTATQIDAVVDAAVAAGNPIVDVTGLGPPAASADTIRQIFIDAEIPRIWFTHRIQIDRVPPSGDWNDYTDPGLYLGTYSQDGNVPARDPGDYYYNTNTHHWRRWTLAHGGVLYFSQITARSVLGTTAVWLGDVQTEAEALERINNFDAALPYYAYVEDGGPSSVRGLDTSTYVAPMDATIVYEYVTLDGSGGLTGAGLTQSQVQDLIDMSIAALVDSAPGTLDTLNELADALGDDPNYAATITAALAAKADTTALATLLAGVALMGQDLRFTLQNGNTVDITLPTGGGGGGGGLPSEAVGSISADIALDDRLVYYGTGITLPDPDAYEWVLTHVERGTWHFNRTADYASATEVAIGDTITTDNLWDVFEEFVGVTRVSVAFGLSASRELLVGRLTQSSATISSLVVRTIPMHILAHTRYAAVREADDSFTATDFEADEATTATGDEIVLPTWDMGLRHLAFAVPSTVTLTDIRPMNGPVNLITAFTASATTITLDAEDHTVYVYDDQLLLSASGQTWVLQS